MHIACAITTQFFFDFFLAVSYFKNFKFTWCTGDFHLRIVLNWLKYTLFYLQHIHVMLSKLYPKQGRIQRFWKGGSLCVGHHGWPTKKMLGFRWSKKVKITLETKAFNETHFFQYSHIFSIFIYNEILSVFQDLLTIL